MAALTGDCLYKREVLFRRKFMSTPPDALSAKLRATFPTLMSVAKELNKSSDKLTAAVNELDLAFAGLNLGVTAWITTKTISLDEERFYHTEEQLGYAKVGNKRGLA